MIEYLGDNVISTLHMLESILAMEEEHIDDLSYMLEGLKVN